LGIAAFCNTISRRLGAVWERYFGLSSSSFTALEGLEIVLQKAAIPKKAATFPQKYQIQV
jgi:hypothetical protein